MSEFHDLQLALEEAKRQSDLIRQEAFVVRERLRRLQRRRNEVERGSKGREEIDALERERTRLEKSAESLEAREAEAASVLRDRWSSFERVSDPTKNVGRLNDRFPILLLPMRIETRFVRVEADGDGGGHQLWVRVYPDDIAVDTFEPLLAEVEVTNARIYWTNVWRAGGNEGERRAAWQSLVKSHGPGRAFWIIEQVQPLNAADEPVREPGDHLLIIVSDAPLAAAEKPLVRDYWQRVFSAQGNAAEIDAAFADLAAALGQARAEVIAADYVPQNLNVAPADPAAVTRVRVEFLELPAADQLPTQQLPWMHAARTALLPERFVVLGFHGRNETLRHVGAAVPPELMIGPDPTAPAEAQLRVEDDELVVPDALKWMTDFDAAVERGMGFRIDLTEAQARTGFDRLFVLGVRLGADIRHSTEQLENLIRNHQRSRKGFSIVPQGAPTNNVEDDVSGYTWRADADVSYDHYFVQDHDDDPDDWRNRKDGRWLATGLGIDAGMLKASTGYFSTDQREARAMNEALWPATIGYFMERMMGPVFSRSTVASTRAYMNAYVVGRGTLPAIRVGHQPYGILPAAPFSRMAWLKREILDVDRFDTGIPNQFEFLTALYALIRKADETWTRLAERVSYVGKPGEDPHQVLLDIVGMHPTSVEFYQRYAESYEQLYNRLKLSSSSGALIAALVTLDYVAGGMDLLRELGYVQQDNDEIPEILSKFFLQAPNLLKGPLIDDQPLSETLPVRPWRDDGTNYMEWLASAARESHDTLRKQEGFLDDRPPTALLYLMLHHALDLSYIETGIQLHLEADLLSEPEAALARREPKFLHIQEAAEDRGSAWQYLYKTESAITSDPDVRIAEYIPRILTLRNPYLNTQIAALERLRDVPTARLERVFAEHLDCCTNRLDAWWLGLLGIQLALMRSQSPGAEGETISDVASRGCYLGAYGWVEDLRPENKRLEPVTLPDHLDAIFNKPGQPPPTADAANFGYIHAPSLDHAVTAAVLRNGYLSNATPDQPGLLAVNLTSERVRIAMGVIEGMRNGQSLGALLGYRLERGLHDREGLFLDSIVFDLRKQFPLVADRFSTTRTAADVAIEAVEARNVVDGLALAEHVEGLPETDRSYPYGLPGLPAVNDPAALAAIDDEVRHLLDVKDAIGDLALAESVYQVVRGNYDRAAGTLDAYSKGNFPPTPEVVQTPRSGVTLTHRVGLQLRAGLDPDDPAHTTPRARGEPAINAWLADVLPPLDTIYCQADFVDAAETPQTLQVTAADLGLLPIDLLYVMNKDGRQGMQALDELIMLHVAVTAGLRPDADIAIRYRDRQPGLFSFFEIAPLVADLRALLLRSRPLRATDARLPNEATSAEESSAEIREVKITRVRDLLTSSNDALTAFVADFDALLADPDESVVADNAIDNVDRLIDGYVEIAANMSRFGLPGTAFGFTLEWRRRELRALVSKLDTLIARWSDRLDAFDQRLTEFDVLAGSDEERIAFLLQAAVLISTETIELPASGDPLQLLATLNSVTRPAFAAALGDLTDLRRNESRVGGLYRAVHDRAAVIARHDSEGLDLDESRSGIVAFVGTLQTKAATLSTDITARLAAADALLAAAASSAPAARIDALTQAMRKITSDDFVVLPEFTLGTEHAAEWQNAFDDQGQLLQYLQSEAGVDFPVDDWLYGVARVREQLHHFESATMHAEALTGAELPLAPLQFPYRSNDAWLALRYPDEKPGSPDEPFVIDEDKLLYTALYHSAFDSAAALHCGVLVDEWTEVIPTREETTGLAFHYDRPSTEPPQTLLLAMPADFTGSWSWQDLVDTLHETLDLARKRGVEPQHLDTEPYARFLPAVLSSVTRLPIMQRLDFAFNNAVQYRIQD